MDQKPINYVFEETPLASTVEEQPYVQPEIMKKYNITSEDLKCTKPKTKKKRNFVNENEKNEAYWKKVRNRNVSL
ncbi:Oidioi.mRNA.OKI2018_I69.PAR.g12411.t1.cds [Oikopleura dioica]|uniref:Oidioi.mRNA.OKI2018_I69.PAR.g12411.t1.cds n=1 Tax=Oikopleura dioica TaxID=34765 RepID=A0ABN7RZZ9_OIKDI|nr:Oidioi.mRNA.OKI2018_I69.PAR.g12411.t1.cds [Oikopleura dioica]